LHFKKGFHGRTSLAVAATDNPSIVAPVNQTDNIDFLPFNDEAALKTYFQTKGNDVAAGYHRRHPGCWWYTIATESFFATYPAFYAIRLMP